MIVKVRSNSARTAQHVSCETRAPALLNLRTNGHERFLPSRAVTDLLWSVAVEHNAEGVDSAHPRKHGTFKLWFLCWQCRD